MNKNLKQFLTASLFFALVNSAVVIKVQAQDRVGTGGTGADVERVNAIFKLEDVARKVMRFFARTPELRRDFPEVNVDDLIRLRDNVQYDVVREELRDDEGTVRTCLNYNIIPMKKIVCNLEALSVFNERPEEYFTLVAHELFGLVGVEESSISHENLIQSYPISGRIARYVSRVSSYDLIFREENNSNGCNVMLVERGEFDYYFSNTTYYTNRWLEIAMRDVLNERGYNIVTNDTQYVDFYFTYTTDLGQPTQEGGMVMRASLVILNENRERVYIDDHEDFYRRMKRAKKRRRIMHQYIENIVANIPTCTELRASPFMSER